MILHVLFVVLSVQTDKAPPEPGPTPENPQVPLDDHLWVLLAAALILGIYVLIRQQRVSPDKLS